MKQNSSQLKQNRSSHKYKLNHQLRMQKLRKKIHSTNLKNSKMKEYEQKLNMIRKSNQMKSKVQKLISLQTTNKIQKAMMNRNLPKNLLNKAINPLLPIDWSQTIRLLHQVDLLTNMKILLTTLFSQTTVISVTEQFSC
ncbi:Hypothetical_protein [Hexamita inflata]|uniref:Hypothetical_protein n=1 Tax=Hexamita inflata TaxID=28002 RepID=A0AA86UXE9_9EUKA|nr:Hypothetical protein HINF_LOCUS39603 [Hexamita inflata]